MLNLFMRITDSLLLKETMFQDIDIGEILNKREEDEFDDSWIKNYEAIESIKNRCVVSNDNQQKIDEIREKVFKSVYIITESSDLAGYISDDFGMICEALVVGYNSSWIYSLAKCYFYNEIPCGEFKIVDGLLSNLINENKDCL